MYSVLFVLSLFLERVKLSPHLTNVPKCALVNLLSGLQLRYSLAVGLCNEYMEYIDGTRWWKMNEYGKSRRLILSTYALLLYSDFAHFMVDRTSNFFVIF